MQARPKSNLAPRGRNKNTKNQRNKGFANELDSYNEPQKFGSSAKGMHFGAPKANAAIVKKRPNSTMHQSAKSTAVRRQQRQPMQEQDDGFMTMTPMTQI